MLRCSFSVRAAAACFAVALLLLHAPRAAGEPRLYSVSRDDGALRVLNPDTGATLSSITMLDATANQSVGGCTSLATNPCDGQMWILYRRTNEPMSVRRLGRLDPGIGQVIHVRQFNIRIASIAFDADGSLYGMTGDGEVSDPEALFLILPVNGSRARLAGYSRGEDGEVIAFSPPGGKLYRMSGRSDLNSPADGPTLEAIDLNSLIATQINITGLPQGSEEITSMVFRKATGDFIMRDRDNNFWRLTTSGHATFIGMSNHYSTGLAFAEPDSQGSLYAAPRSGNFVDVLDPTTGAIIDSFTVRLAGQTIQGFNGLATDPCTGELWAVVRLAGDSRWLATLDQDTGNVALRGPLPLSYAGIAFDASGALFGVTGSSSEFAETVFLLSKTEGGAASFYPLSAAGEGEAIAFFKPLGLLFRASGRDSSRTLWVLDTLNLALFASILTRAVETEITAMVYWPGESVFLSSSIDGYLIRMTPGGLESLITTTTTYKGLAFARPRGLGAAPTCPSDLNGDGAVTASDLALLLTTWGPCP